ncbi:MAG TPA: UDP-N-acetylglucosamine--N-acetylmuramyl-(pentapeptide) pyrophosphoryl-undecaprenol N-acetylglucosamine transferase [Candidatus Limnocylindria bacterium]|nr:UDP-N-acetylglucosamine--N-acetylmuramyl-(pentapeptide) pyrophosphoryl-undecaprenol N-acetylglucosamine transferase [Candidatus Limnocylindria bacterium]
MRLVISGGGTGGHIYPALAVVSALRELRPGAELAYVGGVRGFERRLVGDAGDLPYHQLTVRSLRSAGRSHHTVLDPLRLAAATPQAWRLLGRLRPAGVFSTGGYLAVPLVAAARARGVPTIVWEGNVVPGRATRAIGRFATRVAVAFPPTAEAFGERAFVTGTPIRSFAGLDRAAARAEIGVTDEDRVLLVFGGSQAVARITAALEDALPTLVEEWVVVHLAGEAGMAAANDTRERLPPRTRDRYRPAPFLTDGMAATLVAADLVLGRAGSSTCAEVAAVGVASILVPYPYAHGHQAANAAWLADQGAAAAVPDAELTGERLRTEVAALRNDDARERIAAAARRLGRPNAARDVASALLELADGAA